MVSVIFFLDHSNKSITNEMKNLLESFEHRAPSKSRARRGISKINSNLFKKFFGAKPRYKK